MSPHRKRSSFVTKLIGILLLILVMITVTGIYTYNKFTGIIAGITEEIRPDYKLLTAEELRGSIADAEIAVKSYSITKDTIYLDRFKRAVERTELKLEELNEIGMQVETSESAISALDTLVDQKIDVLGQLLVLSDKYRVDVALFKVETKLHETLTKEDSLNRAQEVKTNRKFFDWLFRRKHAKNSTIDSIGNDKKELSLDQVQEEILEVKNEEYQIASEMKEREFELMVIDQEISTTINKVLDDLRDRELKMIKAETAAAQKTIDRTNKQIAIFFILIGALILFMAYFFMDYVRNSRRYRQALKTAKDEAEELAKTKERFLANMSHEIRTPMNAIFGFTEQLAKSELNEQQREQVDIVQKSTIHLLHLVNEVLDFSKLQAGELKLEKIRFNPAHVLNDIKALMDAEAQKKGLFIETVVDEHLPTTLLGDVQRFRQILLNLLSNSIKFTEEGQVKLGIGIKDNADGRTVLRIVVEDTGIGMTKRQLSRVFREFEQADLTTSRNYGGTGLGLSIVKMLVELKNGTIDIKSKPKEGTTVIIHLPYDLPEIGPDLKQEEDAAGLSEMVDLSELSILVVDDEEYNRRLLANILSNWKSSFTLASNGYEAIDRASENYYDVILMDTRMPELSGVDACQAIRKLGIPSSNARIIALTAAVSIDDRMTYKEAGMDGFLAKPFSEKCLMDKINRVLLKSTDPFQLEDAGDVDQLLDQEDMNVSFQHLLEVCDNDLSFYQEMLETFLKSTSEGFETIGIGMKANDWEMVAEQAHKIASPCGHIGADRLHKMLREIEKMAREDTRPKDLENLIYIADELAREVMESVHQEIMRIRP